MEETTGALGPGNQEHVFRKSEPRSGQASSAAGKTQRWRAGDAPAEHPPPPPHPRARPRSPPSPSPRGPSPQHTEPPAPRRPRGRLCCRCRSRRRPPPRAWKARSREAGAAEARPRRTCSGCVTRRGHGQARRPREAAWACAALASRPAGGARPSRKLSRARGSATDPSRPQPRRSPRRLLPRDSAPLAFASRRESRRRGWAGPAGSRRSGKAG